MADRPSSGGAADGAGAEGRPLQPGRPDSGVPTEHPAGFDELHGAGTPDGFRRLWAPHRMAYIAGETGTGEVDGVCPLCRIPTLDDAEARALLEAVLRAQECGRAVVVLDAGWPQPLRNAARELLAASNLQPGGDDLGVFTSGSGGGGTVDVR